MAVHTLLAYYISGNGVKSVPAIKAFGNVDVIGKPDSTTYMGASNIAAILRAAAIFLKMFSPTLLLQMSVDLVR
ncbi:hypothetical protein R6Q59_005465 [Mikania micrantha]